ncbi:hypothetical protein [Singulisphaera sp. PoT]|uniref:hypothetical protein n=1 Tax=Singulisphaera sp. PoT TaxID=3411797 RepID=UPI003BF53177
MPEIHTIDFDRFAVNILSDAERGTIALQFDISACKATEIRPILNSIDEKFGYEAWSRFRRKLDAVAPVLRVTSPPAAHPDNRHVMRVEMALAEGARMDSSLQVLIAFLRQQRGYHRTLGAQLDPDHEDRPKRIASGDTSEAAIGAFHKMRLRWKAYRQGSSGNGGQD